MFPKEVKTDTPNLVKDLMALKMGFLYNHITDSDVESKMYSYFPLMSSCSKVCSGALNAKIYSEMVNYMGKLVMDYGNSLLGGEEIEILVALCVNRDYA